MTLQNSYNEKDLTIFSEKEKQVYDHYKKLVGKKADVVILGVLGKTTIKATVSGFDWIGAVPCLIFVPKGNKKGKMINLSNIELGEPTLEAVIISDLKLKMKRDEEDILKLVVRRVHERLKESKTNEESDETRIEYIRRCVEDEITDFMSEGEEGEEDEAD